MNLSAHEPPGGWPTPRAAYLHVPFCRHRCGYCNFSVVAGRDELVDRYLDCIDRELAVLDNPLVDTVFVGGGTPTHLSAERFRRLLTIVIERLCRREGFEFTVEANPEDIDAEKLAIMSALGVNRLSLGVQSFDDQKLSVLERGHLGRRAEEVVRQAAEVIENVSIDLIFAAPGESLEVWQQDLQTALQLPLSHLSTYALTFEKGTSFWSRRMHGRLQPAEESIEVEMYQLARTMIAGAGMRQYEISNFARPGSACRHNLAYWQGLGWYGAGPGAARFVGGIREVNHRSTSTYLKRIESEVSPVAESEPLSTEEYARERAAFGVRMCEGIDLARLEAETGVPISRLLRVEIENAVEREWLVREDHRVKLTEQGILFADAVASDFLFGWQ